MEAPLSGRSSILEEKTIPQNETKTFNLQKLRKKINIKESKTANFSVKVVPCSSEFLPNHPFF
jgi:ribosomal protein L23